MLTMVNDYLNHVKIIFRQSWYSWIWGKWNNFKNLAENNENETRGLNRRMNRLKIEERKFGRRN